MQPWQHTYLGKEVKHTIFDSYESTRQIFTPFYISPERSKYVVKDLDLKLAKSDIWSMGLILIELF